MNKHTMSFRRSSVKRLFIFAIFSLLSLSMFTSRADENNGIVDALTFGDSQSEGAHSVKSNNTQKYKGALNEWARKCMPNSPATINGGYLTFTMKVDPDKRNYVTVKFWGEDEANRPTDKNFGRLYLYIYENGKNYSVAGRHESDYTALSLDGNKPPLPGRFFYSTTMLPLWFTKGKSEITLRIASTGRIYGLGSGIAPAGNYQFLMDYQSRGIYKAFTHTAAKLDVTGEVTGSIPELSKDISFPGEEVLSKGGALYDKIQQRIDNRLNTVVDLTSFTTPDAEYLAKSYFLKQFSSYNNEEVVKKVVSIIDAFANGYYENNSSVGQGGNDGWGGQYGFLGNAIYILREQLQSWLDVSIPYYDGVRTRRQAWGDILAASRDHGRMNRRTITNQTLIADGNVYKANKGLIALGDSRAFSESEAQRYLKEAIGLLPWLGNDTAAGSEMIYGSAHYMVTTKGLTRERGYLGVSYGEMASHAAEFYELTGNEEFSRQAVKMINARVKFRRPAIQKSGSSYYEAIEGIGLLSWRGARECDGEFANEIAYGDRYGYTGGIYCAAITKDPELMGYARQMMEDGQLYKSFAELDGRNSHHLDIFRDHEIFKNADKGDTRVPMSTGMPDFVWCDEENAIAAIKDGEDRLWISAYWQAHLGINGVARFHYSTPYHDQYGVMETSPQFRYSGKYEVRGSSIDNVGIEDGAIHAYSGEKQPVAYSEYMSDSKIKGTADFYSLRFGKFLFGINTSNTVDGTLCLPLGVNSAKDIISGNTVQGNRLSVGPKTSMIITLENEYDAAATPAAPSILFLSGQSNSGKRVSWTSASGASYYRVKRAETKDGPYSVIADNVNDTTYLVTENTGAGYIAVCAVNGHGESLNSNYLSLNGYKTESPLITSVLDIKARIGEPLVYTITALNSPTSFDTRQMPDGLILNSANGVIKGVIREAGDYSFSIIAKNGSGSDEKVLNVKVDTLKLPEINNNGLQTAYAGVPWGFRIEADNNPESFAIEGLPEGFLFDSSTGLMAGTFEREGEYDFIASAINCAGHTDKPIRVNVVIPPKPEIISSLKSTALIDVPYSYSIVATYSPSRYYAESLPEGLSIDSQTGVISGIASESGTYKVTLSVENMGGKSSSVLTITIPDSLPAPWSYQDVCAEGFDMTAGYSSYNRSSQVFTVTGAGSDIGQSSDSFHFLSREVKGDMTIIARLASRQYRPGDKVGLMIRESNTNNSAHAFISIDSGAKQIRFPFRGANGWGTDNSQATYTNGNTVPIWMKLTRTGNVIEGYMSTDGKAWTLVGKADIKMNDEVMVGMAVCSRNSLTTVVTFDNVSVTEHQTSIIEQSEHKEISVYPSMVDENVIVSFPYRQVQITVSSMSGAVADSFTLTGPSGCINLSHLIQGMYIISVMPTCQTHIVSKHMIFRK